MNDQEWRAAAIARVIAAARNMPRATPGPGAGCTVHQLPISASAIWELDAALNDLDAVPALDQIPGSNAVEKLQAMHRRAQLAESELGKVRTTLANLARQLDAMSDQLIAHSRRMREAAGFYDQVRQQAFARRPRPLPDKPIMRG